MELTFGAQTLKQAGPLQVESLTFPALFFVTRTRCTKHRQDKNSVKQNVAAPSAQQFSLGLPELETYLATSLF